MTMLLFASPSSIAGITWEEKSRSVILESDTVSATFAFKNDGPGEARITEVNPSCNCVTARSTEKTLASGSSAQIIAVFHGANHLGGETRNILIVSVSGTAQQVDVLKLHVEIRPDLTLDPPFLTWTEGDKPEAKIVRIKESHPDRLPISILRLGGGKTGFLVTDKSTGGEPQFSVAPQSTEKPQRSLVWVTIQKPDKTTHKLIIYIAVRPRTGST